MLWTFNPFAICGSLSIFTLTNLNLLSLFIVISSSAGVSFLHGPHQLNDEKIKTLLCVAIKNNRDLSLHDNGDPVIYTCQFNYIRMVNWLRLFFFLLLLSCISYRVTISICENPLLLYYLWLRLLLRLSSFSLLLWRSGSSENGTISPTLIILREKSVLSHVWALYRRQYDSMVMSFSRTKCWYQNILDHHLIYIRETIIFISIAISFYM